MEFMAGTGFTSPPMQAATERVGEMQREARRLLEDASKLESKARQRLPHSRRTRKTRDSFSPASMIKATASRVFSPKSARRFSSAGGTPLAPVVRSSSDGSLANRASPSVPVLLPLRGVLSENVSPNIPRSNTGDSSPLKSPTSLKSPSSLIRSPSPLKMMTVFTPPPARATAVGGVALGAYTDRAYTSSPGSEALISPSSENIDEVAKIHEQLERWNEQTLRRGDATTTALLGRLQMLRAAAAATPLKTPPSEKGAAAVRPTPFGPATPFAAVPIADDDERVDELLDDGEGEAQHRERIAERVARARETNLRLRTEPDSRPNREAAAAEQEAADHAALMSPDTALLSTWAALTRTPPPTAPPPPTAQEAFTTAWAEAEAAERHGAISSSERGGLLRAALNPLLVVAVLFVWLHLLAWLPLAALEPLAQPVAPKWQRQPLDWSIGLAPPWTAPARAPLDKLACRAFAGLCGGRRARIRLDGVLLDSAAAPLLARVALEKHASQVYV